MAGGTITAALLVDGVAIYCGYASSEVAKFGNQVGTLVGLDYQTGILQFAQDFPGQQIQAVTADGNEIYFAGNAASGRLYCYQLHIVNSMRTIVGNWRVDLTFGARRAPQVVGTSLYVTTARQHVGGL